MRRRRWKLFSRTWLSLESWKSVFQVANRSCIPTSFPSLLPLQRKVLSCGSSRTVSCWTKTLVVALKRAGLGWCSVSLDGPTPAIHDAFRRHPHCFERATDALRHLVRHDVPCNIVTVARRELVESGKLDDIVKLGEDLGVSVVRINFPVPLGRFKEQNNQVLTLAEREEVRKLLRYGNTTMELPREKTTCKAGVTKVNVLPNGDVTPCVFVPVPYGNIRKDSFEDIWKSMRDFSRSFRISGQCPACDPAMNARIFEAADVRRTVCRSA